MSLVDNLERMLAAGHDSALLRFSLGSAYRKSGKDAQAIEHLQAAVELDPQYSAAWKTLARALAGSGRVEEAIAAYEQGIDVAARRGDKQAEREMKVFLKRLKNE